MQTWPFQLLTLMAHVLRGSVEDLGISAFCHGVLWPEVSVWWRAVALHITEEDDEAFYATVEGRHTKRHTFNSWIIFLADNGSGHYWIPCVWWVCHWRFLIFYLLLFFFLQRKGKGVFYIKFSTLLYKQFPVAWWFYNLEQNWMVYVEVMGRCPEVHC